ncbi:MAG TPA: DUF4386 domain-containing protein [Thermoanaerobaculia bacterium]|nr:DUF4386 domain-containing protein [Thermoanaerobaculia bacterium]
MTRTTNARIAGFTFLFYIAAGVATMVLFGRAAGGAGIAAKLASLAEHATEVRVVVVLTLLTSFSALVLGVTLYAITRVQDPDLAMLALICRVIEGVNGATSIRRLLGLPGLAAAAGANAPNAQAAQALGAFLLSGDGAGISAIFFAVGSTIFAFLLLRGRMIPVPMAWLGVVASVLVAVALPLQLFGFIAETWSIWMPLLVFEVAFALWLLIKGAAMPPTWRADSFDRVP